MFWPDHLLKSTQITAPLEIRFYFHFVSPVHVDLIHDHMFIIDAIIIKLENYNMILLYKTVHVEIKHKLANILWS